MKNELGISDAGVIDVNIWAGVGVVYHHNEEHRKKKRCGWVCHDEWLIYHWLSVDLNI